MARTFSASVDAWVAQTRQRTLAVFRSSLQELVTTMQKPVAKGGNMPVDTGNLRNSLMASTSQMPTFRDAPTAEAEHVAVVIAGLDLGDTLYAGYTANYAAFQEYGARGQAGRRFVGLAVQKWQEIVDGEAKKLRRRVGT